MFVELWRDRQGVGTQAFDREIVDLAARGGCWFRGGNIEIHLGVEQDFSPAKKAHPAILVSILVAFADHLQAHNFLVDCDDNFPGFHRIYAVDPFGNRIEFLQTK